MWFPFGIIGTDALAGVYFVFAEAAAHQVVVDG